MKKKFFFPVLMGIFLAFPMEALGQPLDTLRQNLLKIISGKDIVAGVSILSMDGTEIISIRGNERFPMQSVFKFHIGIVMLYEIDQGNFDLSQVVKIEKDELLPGIYSPIRDSYPNGVELSLKEILSYAISLSDNVACDVLLKLLGGPIIVERFFHERGFSEVSIKINEEIMQNNWDLQFQNWSTPTETNRILKAFFDNSEGQLSTGSHEFLWQTMIETKTGAKRLKGNLPAGIEVAHKTGWSGRNEVSGITAAVNDVGAVFLSDGGHFFISVYITDSREDHETNEEIIAQIAEAVWKYFT